MPGTEEVVKNRIQVMLQDKINVQQVNLLYFPDPLIDLSVIRSTEVPMSFNSTNCLKYYTYRREKLQRRLKLDSA